MVKKLEGRISKDFSNTEFKEMVVNDVLGEINPKLREPILLMAWHQELLDLRVNTEIKISMLEDSEFWHGAMNHAPALDSSHQAAVNTRKFLGHVNNRIKESQYLVRHKDFVMFDPPSTTPLIRIEALKDQVLTYRTFLGRSNGMVQKNVDLLAGLLDGIKKQRKNNQTRLKKLYRDCVLAKNLLQKVICMWEDGCLDEEIIEEIRLFLEWKVPYRTAPASLEHGARGVFHNYEDAKQTYLED